MFVIDSYGLMIIAEYMEDVEFIICKIIIFIK